MPKPNLDFRKANPIYPEGKLFAHYLDQAAEGFFGFMLGGRSEEIIAEGDFYLQAIALNTELRGSGLGSALMDLAEEKAHISGSKRISLDVSADNHVARRMYERRGMFIESQWPKRLSIPRLKFYRITKVL
jgi:ribosomal protein S18 acetylase RimI-like enzyme